MVGIGAGLIAIAVAAVILVPVALHLQRKNLQDTLASNERINDRQCQAQVDSARVTGELQLAETKDTNRTDLIAQRDWINASKAEDARNASQANASAALEDTLFPDSEYSYPKAA